MSAPDEKAEAAALCRQLVRSAGTAALATAEKDHERAKARFEAAQRLMEKEFISVDDYMLDEIALLRAAELPKVVRIQEILSSRALPPTTEGGGGQGHYPQRGPSDGEAPRPGGSSAQPDRSRAQAPRTAELGGNGGPSRVC